MSYHSIADHQSMILDRVRNEVYARAIRDVVNEDSVVLDLGAGLGILGFIAARAGARKVYSVEPAPVIEAAKQVAQSNGLTNVEFIQARAEQLQLPEKVDVLVSVFTGNFLLTEDLLPSLFYARDKFLKPGGIMLPGAARMVVAPVSAPAYFDKHIADWTHASAPDHPNHTQGIDYRDTRRFSANTVYYDSADNVNATLLAEPAMLKTMNFLSATAADCNDSATVTTTRAGPCHGWLGWFDMQLGAEWLSTGPAAAQLHWRQAFLPVDPAIHVEQGEDIRCEIKRPTHGEWSWITKTLHGQQKGSTFLSEPVTPTLLRKKSDDFSPEKTELGDAATQALALFDGTNTAHTVAETLARAYPETFPTAAASRQFVTRLIERYC